MQNYLEACNNFIAENYFEQALEQLALAAGIDASYGPPEIMEAIVTAKECEPFLVLAYATLMARALRKKMTLGRGMYKSWQAWELEERMGKHVVRRHAPSEAVYPYYLIYWQAAEAQALSKDNCKENFRIAESAALLEKKNVAAYTAGLAIFAERMAYTYSRIGNGDINKLKEMISEFLEEEIPKAIEVTFINWLYLLENIKTAKLAQQKQALLDMSHELK